MRGRRGRLCLLRCRRFRRRRIVSDSSAAHDARWADVLGEGDRHHVFCLQNRLRGDRFARHWHDVVRLDEAGAVAATIADLALAVARHKGMFFVKEAADRSPIDYMAAVSGDFAW